MYKIVIKWSKIEHYLYWLVVSLGTTDIGTSCLRFHQSSDRWLDVTRALLWQWRSFDIMYTYEIFGVFALHDLEQLWMLRTFCCNVHMRIVCLRRCECFLKECKYFKLSNIILKMYQVNFVIFWYWIKTVCFLYWYFFKGQIVLYWALVSKQAST